MISLDSFQKMYLFTMYGFHDHFLFFQIVFPARTATKIDIFLSKMNRYFWQMIYNLILLQLFR